MKKISLFIILFMFVSFGAYGKNNASNDVKTKFYNFDDLLIDGKIKKPQILYTDSRQRVKFERLLKLKKDFIPNLLATKKDATLK